MKWICWIRLLKIIYEKDRLLLVWFDRREKPLIISLIVSNNVFKFLFVARGGIVSSPVMLFDISVMLHLICCIWLKIN